MEARVLKHFSKADPVLSESLQRMKSFLRELAPRKSNDYFADLCEAIVNQQLSEKAGATIYRRFLDSLLRNHPTPEVLISMKDQSLRDVGMSWSKVRFIKALAQSVLEKSIDLNALDRLDDADVIKELTKLHGIGPWTAEMFLMFSLGRPDVFSYGDVGLRRAIKQLYGFKKDPTDRQIAKIIIKWAPYKTYACRVLWKSLDLKNIVQ